MNYWDTSALVKLYVAEPNSAQFISHLAITGSANTSALARWEIFRVFARKEADNWVGRHRRQPAEVRGGDWSENLSLIQLPRL